MLPFSSFYFGFHVEDTISIDVCSISFAEKNYYSFLIIFPVFSKFFAVQFMQLF